MYRSFWKNQFRQIKKEGWSAIWRKSKRLPFLITRPFQVIITIPLVLITRLIRPLILVRFGFLPERRIGHFSGNIELYLCERDEGINVPNRPYIDIFCLKYKELCNNQLAVMWRRILHVWPWWIVSGVIQINRIIPFGEVHKISGILATQLDRDIHNLLDKTPPHIDFTEEEKAFGDECLEKIGIPKGSDYVCLNVRDSAYLASCYPNVNWTYHNYRDCDLDNFVLVAEELANRGYYVIRMGAKVNKPFRTSNTKVVDYATNGMRTDFMDIYLGATCKFTITNGSGWDGVPYIFRRPMVYVNYVPLGYLFTFIENCCSIPHHLWSIKENRELTLKEIFDQGTGFFNRTEDYEANGVMLIDNTQEEIHDVCFEMVDRLNGDWKSQKDDEKLQKRFWDIFPKDAKNTDGVPLHGEIRSKIGADFLRNNPWWIQ